MFCEELQFFHWCYLRETRVLSPRPSVKKSFSLSCVTKMRMRNSGRRIRMSTSAWNSVSYVWNSTLKRKRSLWNCFKFFEWVKKIRWNRCKFIVCRHLGLISMETWLSWYSGKCTPAILMRVGLKWCCFFHLPPLQTCMMTTPLQPRQPKASSIKLPARGRRWAWMPKGLRGCSVLPMLPQFGDPI